LAIAAQGILNQICKEKGVTPSQIHGLIESKPPVFKDIFRSAQNFFKHGRHNVPKWKGMVLLIPEFTELVLIDCLSMHQRLFDTLTPTMRCFAVRYSLFNPGAFPCKIAVKGIKIEQLRGFTRREFFKKVCPRLRVQIGDLSAPHSGNPPE
jgi:hypothetical protein